MVWSYDSLWQKSKIFADRAHAEGRDTPLYAFWSSLALELLGRAALATIHPALLADPSDKAGDNVLYAFSVGNITNPRSIMMKTVFSRCRRIFPCFTEEDEKFCCLMAERRNAELHTGEPVFYDWPTSLWLAKYYRAVHTLLAAQKKGLEDFFAADEADGAQKMIDSLEEKWLSQAKKELAAAKAAFERLSSEEQTKRRRVLHLTAHVRVKRIDCPSCGDHASIWGGLVESGDTRIEDDEIVWDEVVLPTDFECLCCGLRLNKHGLLHALGLGGQYTVQERQDPSEYYAVDNDPADHYEPDYGNC
jgi:hypothetical protein